MRVLEIVAGSWPIAFMFLVATAGIILLYLIYGKRKDHARYIEAQSRDVTPINGNKTWQD